jgi:integrase
MRADILPSVKGHRSDAITRNDVARVIEGIARRGSYQAANLALTIVRWIYRWGVSTGRCEWSVGCEFRDAYRLQLLLAVRVGEVLNARWTEIDLAGRVWVIPACRTKSRREHRLPLSDLAIDVLQGRQGSSPGLFPSEVEGQTLRTRSAARSLLKLCRRHSIDPRFSTHDLPRTASTRMGDLGAADDIIERFLNHVAPTTARRVYNRSDKFEEVKAALDAWAVELGRIVS